MAAAGPNHGDALPPSPLLHYLDAVVVDQAHTIFEYYMELFVRHVMSTAFPGAAPTTDQSQLDETGTIAEAVRDWQVSEAVSRMEALENATLESTPDSSNTAKDQPASAFPRWLLECAQLFDPSMQAFVVRRKKWDVHTLVTVILGHLPTVFAPALGVGENEVRHSLECVMKTSESRFGMAHSTDLEERIDGLRHIEALMRMFGLEEGADEVAQLLHDADWLLQQAPESAIETTLDLTGPEWKKLNIYRALVDFEKRLVKELGQLDVKEGAFKLATKGWCREQKLKARQQKARMERIGKARQWLVHHVDSEVDLQTVLDDMGCVLHALTGVQTTESTNHRIEILAVGWHWSRTVRSDLAESPVVPTLVSVSTQCENESTPAAPSFCTTAPVAPVTAPSKDPPPPPSCTSTALQVQIDAVKASESTLGSAHPATATSKSHLAALYKAQGQHQKALQLQLDVLQFSNQVLGTNHQETAKSKNNIACTYAELGDFVQAELFMRGAVSIWSKTHPPSHPELQSARQRWGQLKAALTNTSQKKQKAPSPNAPCPCGSGKKHKKCKCIEHHH